VPEATNSLISRLKASKAYTAVDASIRTRPWYWAGGGAIAIVAATVLAFGGLFGPSGHDICRVSVDRAMAYGVLPSGATPDGNGKSTNVNRRRECKAVAGENTYIVTADLKPGCNDLKKELAAIGKPPPDAKETGKVDDNGSCLSIYAVERSDGMSLYQARAVPDDAGPAPEIPSDAAQDNGGGDANAGGDAGGAAPSGGGPVDGSDVEVAHPSAEESAQQQ
jgi:hypothetical protein